MCKSEKRRTENSTTRETTVDSTEKKEIRTRCSPYHFSKVMRELKPIIGERQRSRISETPFAVWMDMPVLTLSPSRVGYVLRRFDVRSSSFVLVGDVAIPFRSPDFSAIVGLKHDGLLVDTYKKKHSAFLSRCFGGRLRNVARPRIREGLLLLARSSDENEVDDFVRFFILLAFNCVVFPVHNQRIPGFVFPYLDDLTTFFDHAWGDAAFRFLHREVSCLGSKFFVDGCLVGLMALVYEMLPSLGLYFRSNVYPRMFRWENNKIPINHEKLESLFKRMDSTQVRPIQPFNEVEKSLFLRRVSKPKDETSDDVERMEKARSLTNEIKSAKKRCPESEGRNSMARPSKKKPAVAQSENVAENLGGLDKSRGKHEPEDVLVVDLSDSNGEDKVLDGFINVDVVNDTRDVRRRTASNRGSDISASKAKDSLGTNAVRLKKRKASPKLVNSPSSVPTPRMKAEEHTFIDVDGDSDSQTTDEDLVEFKGRVDFIGHENASGEDVGLVMEFLARDELEAIVWDDGCKNLSGRELRTLLFREPIDSEIINAYMRIMRNQSLENGSEIYCVDTNVQENILYHLEKKYGSKRNVPDANYEGFISNLSSSTRHSLMELKEDTFRRCKYVVFPMNDRWHWFLLVFDARRRVFKVWNSVHDARSTRTAKVYVKFLGDYTRRFSGFELAGQGGGGVVKERCRQQESSLSCGIFACLWLHCLAYDTDEIWEFEEKANIEAYRVRIAATILGSPV